MYMIKCFWFLRSLKQLFIISLISCFGLLASSFVNADWIFQDVWLPFTVAWQIDYTLNARPSGAWVVEGGWVVARIFYVPKRWSSYQYYSIFYYNTDWNMVKNSFQNNYPYQWGVYQVVFDSFYLTTPENLSGCSSAFPCGWVSTNYETYKNNQSYKWKMTRFAYYYNNSSAYESSICLIFDSFDSAFCFYDNQNRVAVNWLTVNPAEFNNDLVWNSPWVSNSSQWWQVFIPSTWSDLNWNIVLNSWYTNSDMVDWFECVGLQPSLCYWWFDINNIFDPSEQFEDFTWYIAGQGATIFDIYNLYSWNFTSLNQFLNTVLSRYQNWQINSFKTEPKALLMLWAQMNTAWFKTSYIASYCNLLLNENNNNLYTWNSVDDLRVQSCLKSKKVWDSLKNWWNDIWFQTSISWIFTWWDVDFDPDTFFSNIMDTIDINLNQNLSWWIVWLLPWYIVLIFLALVFIRLITH